MPALSPRFAGVVAAAILASGYAPAVGEQIYAARNIRVGALLTADDIAAPSSEDALRAAVDFIGLEAARPIYKGDALLRSDVRAPTLVARNAIVTMEFITPGLSITSEGRALEPGAAGDRIRVMNLGSKRVVSAIVVATNSVRTR
jgi:flagella basal body P-ring formation protein FlgA